MSRLRKAIQAFNHTIRPIRKYAVKLAVIELDENGNEEKVTGYINAVDCGNSSNQAMRKAEKKFRIRAISAERKKND